MPIRRKIAGEFAEQVVGAHIWNGAIGECETMPTDRYDQTVDTVDVLFERMVDRIDWPRLMIEASARHLSTHPEQEPFASPEAPCGACVREALLAGDRPTDWPIHEPPPAAERRDDGRDWAADLAAAMGYRRPGQAVIRGRDRRTTRGGDQ